MKGKEMKFLSALKKVKKGKIVTFRGGYLKPYDDHIFFICRWNEQEKLFYQWAQTFNFYERTDFNVEKHKPD